MDMHTTFPHFSPQSITVNRSKITSSEIDSISLLKTHFITFSQVKSHSGLDSSETFGIVAHDLQFSSTYHSHDFVELVYAPEGGLFNNVDGEYFKMEAESLCFINVGTPHIVIPITEKERHKRIYNFLINPELFNHLSSILKHTEEFPLLHKYSFHYFPPQVLQNAILKNLHQLMMSYQDNNFHLNIEGLGQLLLLFHKLNHTCQLKTDNRDQLTQNCLALIRQNPHNITLAQLANQLCYSQSHLSRHIKNQTNQTISQWIAQTKLHLAQRLLEDTNDTIANIAEQVGYKSESHFFRSFKAHFQLTPKQYRDYLK